MKLLRAVKKGNKNVLVEFDNGESILLSYDIFLKSGLRKNDVISPDRFSALSEEEKIFRIKQKAFRLLGRRLHSGSELKLKLLSSNPDRSLVEKIIDDLYQNKYLDDFEFALQFISEKSRLKKWGKIKIKSELIRKGISGNLIQKALDKVSNPEENFGNAFELAGKKLIAIKRKESDQRKVKEKLIRYLLSKGFDFDTINSVIQKHMSGGNSD